MLHVTVQVSIEKTKNTIKIQNGGRGSPYSGVYSHM